VLPQELLEERTAEQSIMKVPELMKQRGESAERNCSVVVECDSVFRPTVFSNELEVVVFRVISPKKNVALDEDDR
jgi:hypothetical protein